MATAGASAVANAAAEASPVAARPVAVRTHAGAEHRWRSGDVSGLAHDAAGASLTVAIGLLVLVVTAAVVLWAQVDDPRAQRLARRCLEPLSTWCLVALGTHTLALGMAGDLGVLSLALPLVLGAAAVALRSAAEAGAPRQAARTARAAAPPRAASPVGPAPAPAPARSDAPAPAPDGTLWAGRRRPRAADRALEPRVSFQSPAFLVGLALIPLLVALYVRTERRPQTFAPARLLPSVAPNRAGWRRHAALAGYGAALVALLVALAKPQATVARPTEQARVVVVTDRSGSMLAKDVAPNRLAAAEKAAGTFLDAVPDEVRVGAVAFNQRAEVLQSPTRDHDAVREALQSVRAAGTTATGDAIKAALQSIKGNAPAAIVLLSDGKSVRGSDPVEAAQDAKRRKIPIYTVALGTAHGTIDGGRPVPPDPQTLARIAQVTGGRAFTAGDVDSLDQVYERLGSQVATEQRKVEVTSVFAGGALLLMALSALSSIRWVGRLV